MILIVRQYIFSIVVYIALHLIESSNAVNLSHFSSHNLQVILISTCTLRNPFVHLLTGFCLLSDRNFVTLSNELLNIFLQVTLMEAYHFLKLPWWNTQIEDLRTYHRILIVNDEPLSPSVEYYLIIVLALDFPISLHPRCHFINLFRWYID
jgi:hypothetical protein